MSDLGDVAAKDQEHALMEAWFTTLASNAAKHLAVDQYSTCYEELCDAVTIWAEDKGLEPNKLAAAGIAFVAHHPWLLKAQVT